MAYKRRRVGRSSTRKRARSSMRRVRGRGKFSLYRRKTNRSIRKVGKAVGRSARAFRDNPMIRTLGNAAMAYGGLGSLSAAANGAAALSSAVNANDHAKVNALIARKSISGSGRYRTTISGRGRYNAPFLNDSRDMTAGSKFTGVKFQAAPATKSDAGGMVISNQEFVCNVYGNDPTEDFSTESFEVNPGLAKCFPMLSQFAANFQKYEMVQCVFHFETSLDAGVLQSATGQVGSVLMYAHGDISEANFQNIPEFESNGGTNAPTTKGQVCGVECDPKQLNGLPNEGLNYMRNSDWTHNLAKAEFDQARFQIAVANTPPEMARAVLGKLYVSYTVRLIKPHLHSYFGKEIRRDKYIAQRPESKDVIPKQVTTAIADSGTTAAQDLTAVQHFKELGNAWQKLILPNGPCAAIPERDRDGKVYKSIFEKSIESNLETSLEVLTPTLMKFPSTSTYDNENMDFVDKIHYAKGDMVGNILKVSFPPFLKGLIKVTINSLCTPKSTVVDTSNAFVHEWLPKRELMSDCSNTYTKCVAVTGSVDIIDFAMMNNGGDPSPTGLSGPPATFEENTIAYTDQMQQSPVYQDPSENKVVYVADSLRNILKLGTTKAEQKYVRGLEVASQRTEYLKNYIKFFQTPASPFNTMSVGQQAPPKRANELGEDREAISYTTDQIEDNGFHGHTEIYCRIQDANGQEENNLYIFLNAPMNPNTLPSTLTKDPAPTNAAGSWSTYKSGVALQKNMGPPPWGDATMTAAKSIDLADKFKFGHNPYKVLGLNTTVMIEMTNDDPTVGIQAYHSVAQLNAGPPDNIEKAALRTLLGKGTYVISPTP